VSIRGFVILTPGQISRRANFYFQLGSLLSAGVPILQALEQARNNVGRSYESPITTILNKIQQGATFSEAVAATGKWLPAFDRALFDAGEKSGRLDASFRSLGNYYTQRASMLREIISGLAYPIFILHLAVLIFPLGYLTRLFLANGARDFVIQKLTVLLPCYAVVFAGVVAFQGSRGEYWRALLERFTSAVPLLGSARKDLFIARLSGALEALLSAGVPIIQAWETAAHASGSMKIKSTVARAVPQMELGVTPSETLRQSSFFPDVFRNLYATGEASGQLDSTLQRLHSYYEEQATTKFRNIASWTPKLVFLLVAIGVGYQVISFYMGYFKQLDQIGF
jgi:type IV pilus assembly protein PilC